jgi:heme-degrading monooxygenase HmoA
MNCTRIALYGITSGTFDEVVTQAKAGMIPLFQNSPGFVSYGVAKTGKDTFASLSTWQTHEQADAAGAKAATWVKDNGRGHYVLREDYIGDLAIDVQTRPIASVGR